MDENTATAPAPSPAPQTPAAPAPGVAVAPIPVAAPTLIAPAVPVATPPAPVAEAKPEAPIAASPESAKPEAAKPETILGATETPKAPDKPAAEAAPKPAEGEKKPDGETKAPEGQSAEPAPPPTYEAFKFPEGLTPDTQRLGEFSNLLGEFETTTKADHAALQALGQKLVDFHVAEVAKTVQAVQRLQQETENRQRVEWLDAFKKEHGERWQTVSDSALNFIRTHGGSDAQQAEFRDLMEKSGLGNHPVMIRLLANANRSMSEGRQLAAVKPVSIAPRSKVEAMYGRKAS
jgi:hypothetical protein